MEIFEQDNKINFVDENNVVVGFDYGQSCCEQFGYFWSREVPTEINEGDDMDFIREDYVFDPDFFELIDEKKDWGGSMAVFKIVHKNDANDVIYLTLHNTHNGYYAHGFNMNVGGIDVRIGDL